MGDEKKKSREDWNLGKLSMDAAVDANIGKLYLNNYSLFSKKKKTSFLYFIYIYQQQIKFLFYRP